MPRLARPLSLRTPTNHRFIVILPLMEYTGLGIGGFTLLDSAKVTGQDAGNNFFLHRDGIGKSRAEEAVKYLTELNETKSKADKRVRHS